MPSDLSTPRGIICENCAAPPGSECRLTGIETSWLRRALGGALDVRAEPCPDSLTRFRGLVYHTARFKTWAKQTRKAARAAQPDLFR